jgi:hypothetical protein
MGRLAVGGWASALVSEAMHTRYLIAWPGGDAADPTFISEALALASQVRSGHSLAG